MITLAWYFLKVIICSGILCGYYFLALRNKAFHRWNRFYILASVVISLLVPIMKINFFPKPEEKGTVVQMLQTISYGDEAVVEYSRNNSFQLTTQNITEGFYLLVSLVFFLIFLISLYKITRLKKKFPAKEFEGISFINTSAKGTPFSFFKSIFWNKAIDLHSKSGQQIFNHEIAHIKEKHSYDKIFMNIVLIFFWINPFFWLLQKELFMIHEFIADKEALEDSDISSFAEMILQTVYPGQNFSLAHNFFYSPLKRRLLMLTKNKNPKVNYISRLLVLPLAAIVFFAFTLKVKNKNINFYDGKTITVIIDAGHGGKDPGAHSSDGINEKDVTLSIAKKIADLNSNTHLKIILSRDNDQTISVKDRVVFAENNKADLFIALHVNAAVNEQLNGFSVLVTKNYNEQDQLLGSALINELKKSYKTEDKIGERDLGVWVLDHNVCPAALINCGYMTNPDDVAFINKSADQEKIAQNILDAINVYASSEENGNSKSKASIGNSKLSKSVINDTVPGKVYTKVQVEAQFPGGLTAWSRYITRAIQDSISNFTKADYGTCVIRFIVNVDGKVSDVVATTMRGTELAKVSTSAIKNGPKWIPASQNGKTVAAYRLQPVTLQNPDDNKKATSLINRKKSVPDKVYTKVETEASFPGGLPAWSKYIIRAIQDSISNFTKADYGTCVVRFIVNVDGKVSDVVATTMRGTELAKVSTSAIKNGPKWIPASQNGKTVAAYRLQPVTLQNPDQKKSTSDSNPDLPKITLNGLTGGKIPLKEIADASQLKTSSDKYSVASFTVYFSGANFPYVKSITQDGGQFNNELLEEWEKIKPGTSVTFDNVKIKDNNGNLIKTQKAPFFTVVESAKKSSKNTRMDSLAIFTKLQKQASFPGGQSAWLKYISRTIQKNGNELIADKNSEGTCKVRFIVSTSGYISDVQAITKQGSQLADVAVNAIKNGPRWIPGMQNGHIVSSFVIQPVRFLLNDRIDSRTIEPQ